MYGIFTNIYHKNQPNVGIYIPYMTWILWDISSSNEVDEDEAIACYCGPLWLFAAFPSTPFPIAGISSATHSSGHIFHKRLCVNQYCFGGDANDGRVFLFEIVVLFLQQSAEVEMGSVTFWYNRATGHFRMNVPNGIYASKLLPLT